MNDRTKSNIPFAGLHAHSGVGSPFDGLGYPAEHMEFAFQNGNDSLALTDHGNMNGFAYQVQHARAMIKEGKDFKPIFGVEAYFLPSIDDWREQLEKAKADKKAKKNIDKSQAGTTIEDESTKREVKNILNRRRHLILLAQNQKGLNNIFSLVSKSYSKDNFYRFPRMDYKTLSEHSEGVIAASACLTKDAILHTDKGKQTLGEVIDRLHNNEKVLTLSYNIEKDKICYEEVAWGDITRKNAEIVKIKLKNGNTLRLTPDHKVFTDKGWIEAGDLKKHKKIKILSLK